MKYTVFMCQGTDRVGEVEYTKLIVSLKYLTHGSWEMDVEYLPDVVTWQSRIEVVRNGTLIFSGPFSKLNRTWTYAETDTRRFSGTCDFTFLEHRFASPDPSLSTGPYNTQVADVRSGVAETIIRQYIYYNAGAGAVTTRVVDGLALATDQGRGSNVAGRARFDDLVTLCRTLALAGGVAFEVVGMQVRFYVPSDKTSTVVFSEKLDNIEKFEYRAGPPKANYVVVLGGGEGTSRTSYEIGDALSIMLNGRREAIVDARQTSETSELAQKGIATLQEMGNEDLNLQIIPGLAAVESMEPFINFYLGDVVTLMIDDLTVQAQVQEIRIEDSQDKVQESITIGNFGKGSRYITSRDLLSTLSSRIRRLESAT